MLLYGLYISEINKQLLSIKKIVLSNFNYKKSIFEQLMIKNLD